MKCRKLGSIPLQKHNFPSTIVFKCQGVKVLSGNVLPGGIDFPVAPGLKYHATNNRASSSRKGPKNRKIGIHGPRK